MPAHLCITSDSQAFKTETPSGNLIKAVDLPAEKDPKMQHFTLNFRLSVAPLWTETKSLGLQDKDPNSFVSHSRSPTTLSPSLFSSAPAAFFCAPYFLPILVPFTSVSWSPSFLNPANTPLPPGRLPAFKNQMEGLLLTAQAELNTLSAHSHRPDFYCLLPLSVSKELTPQCRKHRDSVGYGGGGN